MTERSFLSDILRRVASQTLLRREPKDDDVSLDGLCLRLLQSQTEASGLIMARQILDRYSALDAEEKIAFFHKISFELGQDDTAIAAAIAQWHPDDPDASRRLHFVAEPRSQGLIRSLNSVPGATSHLVAMRSDLLRFVKTHPALKGLDQDFQHLFASWFNRGFLEIRRIDWQTPAAILEKIIAYEAVHEISDWDDLRRRVGDPDRRLFAFFHPAMPGEPLIFVEVALALDIPDAIAPILQEDRTALDPETASTAVFYSISNCQKGLRGISFGNFLIKQVVLELQRALPELHRFVTLSPVPGLRAWVARAMECDDPLLDGPAREVVRGLADDELPPDAFVRHVAARYLTQARRDTGTAYDPVAHFHLGNGAALHAVHAHADLSPRGRAQSWGVMVTYLYDGAQIDMNHQAYSMDTTIAMSPEVRGLAVSQKDISYV